MGEIVNLMAPFFKCGRHLAVMDGVCGSAGGPEARGRSFHLTFDTTPPGVCLEKWRDLIVCVHIQPPPPPRPLAGNDGRVSLSLRRSYILPGRNEGSVICGSHKSQPWQLDMKRVCLLMFVLPD